MIWFSPTVKKCLLPHFIIVKWLCALLWSSVSTLCEYLSLQQQIWVKYTYLFLDKCCRTQDDFFALILKASVCGGSSSMMVYLQWWQIVHCPSSDGTTLLNEALRGLTRLSNSLVWNWLNRQGWRSDGKKVCSDLMVSSVVKSLGCSPGLLWSGCIYLFLDSTGDPDCLISKGSVTRFLL